MVRSFWRRLFSVSVRSSVRSPGAAVSGTSQLRYRLAQLRTQLLPWLSVVFLVLLISVPLASFIWLVFATSTFQVQSITIVDAREHTADAARQLIEAQLATSTNKQNIFFIRTNELEDDLKNQLPQIRTVHITRHLPGTIKAIVQEKTPALLLLSSGDYFYVDEQGIPYEEASLETLPGVILPIVKNNDQSSQVTLGAPAVAPTFVQFVQYVQTELPHHLPAQVAEIRTPSLAAREIHVLLTTNWQIRFDATRSPDSQLQLLARVVNESISPTEQQSLEYIDLRIPNRIYYKSRATAPSPATTPTTTPDAS